MAKYPVRIDLSKIKPKRDYKPAPPTTQKDLDRHARIQGEEARSGRLLMKTVPANVIRNTIPFKETPKKKGR